MAVERLLPSDNDLQKEEWVKPRGRIKFAYSTKTGMLIGGRIKTNQDNLVVEKNVLQDIHLFAVCDGHGTTGR